MIQNHLFPAKAAEKLPILLLSIRPLPAERILRGEKHFELRKALPKRPFSRVFLYESGGRGIVGCFDAGEVLQTPVEDLWEEVGERAATKERFDAYFKGWKKGYAIEVRSPVKFDKPLLPPALRDVIPTFTAPQSYLLLQPTDKLYGLLEDTRRGQLSRQQVWLERIAPTEYAAFVEAVTQEISRNYDEITPAFAEALLHLDALGEDPNGIFTTKKEVFSAFDAAHRLIGFTTLTFKLGGSIKTGPTILFPEYRSIGYGTALRQQIVGYARSQGARKLYCTCPDTEFPVISHLLRNGLRVEAHLSNHYRPQHGELVFGMMLEQRPYQLLVREPRRARSATVEEASRFSEGDLACAVHRLLTETGFPMDCERARHLVGRANEPLRRPYEAKPFSMLCLADDSRCVGLTIMIPKRGGASKGILATSTTDTGSIAKLLAKSEATQRLQHRRKLYFAHPLTDPLIVDLLLSSGYRSEGILREPYTPGLDTLVLSKDLD